MLEKSSNGSIDDKYRDIVERIERACKEAGRDPSEITLLAATKTRGEEEIRRIKELGVTVIGENRVQEYETKKELFDTLRFETHLIGHLQKNKVNHIVGKAEYIDSVDSVEIAEKISARALSLGIIQKVMVEVNIGNDEAKSGVSPDVTAELIKNISKFGGIAVKGLMVMPPKVDNSIIFELFNKAHKLFIDITDKKIDNVYMDFLSMGMSTDFETAIKCGSNMVRLGTALFGLRY